MALNEVILLDVLRAEFTRAERILASHEVDVIDSLLIRLEHLYGYLIHINDNGLAPNLVKEEAMRRSINCLKEVLDILNDQALSLVTPLANNGKGRPRYDLPMDQLVYLVENGFTCSKISKMLGILQRTVHRRMSEYGISICQMYSNIADPELMELIAETHISFPNAVY